MYHLTEDVGDYAIDAPPTDFEPSEENVLIVQQRDEDLKTLDEGLVALERAFNDLQTLTAVNVAVRECIAHGQVRPGVIQRAMSLNRQLAKRYPGQALAAESITHGSSALVALQAEEKEERGFFVKIWDAICKAFKWVWEKIASLFATGPEKTEEKAEDAKESAEKLKDVNKDEIDLEKLKPALLAVSQLCYHNKDKLTVSKLLDWIKVIETNIKTLTAVMGGLNDSYHGWAEFAKSASANMSKEDFAKQYTTVQAKVIEGINHARLIPNLPSVDNDPEYKASGFVTKTRAILMLGKGQKLIFVESTLPTNSVIGEGGVDFGSLVTPAKTDPVAHVMDEVPVGDHAKHIADGATRLAKEYARSAELFLKVAKRETDRIKELEKVGTLQFSGGDWDTGTAAAAKEMLVGLGRNIALMLGTSAMAANNIQRSIDGLSAFVVATQRAVKKDTQEAPKEGS